MPEENSGKKIGKHRASSLLVGNNSTSTMDLLEQLERSGLLLFVHSADNSGIRKLFFLRDEEDLRWAVRQMGTQEFRIPKPPKNTWPRKKLGRRRKRKKPPS